MKHKIIFMKAIKRLLKKSNLLVSLVHRAQKNIRILKTLWSINFIKTIYVNFKTQSFRNALKLPIHIYGKLKIRTLSGHILVDAPIYFGKIKLGYNTEYFSASKGSAVLSVPGTLHFRGRFIASIDCTISSSGILEFGDLSRIGNGVKIACRNHISIGKGSGIALDSQIYDTNFHYTREVKTGLVRKNAAPIIIGNFCWIGNRSTIMKGTILPDYAIVAGNSLCNKDYTNGAPAYPVIAGTPAKIIGEGVTRIFDYEEECKIDAFFAEHPDEETYMSYPGVKDESDQIARIFDQHP